MNHVRFNVKMISNTWYVNTFAISLSYLERHQSMMEAVEDVWVIIQKGMTLTTHNQSIHLRAEFANDTVNDRLYPKVLNYIFSDRVNSISRITENCFCRQVELRENEIAWVAGERGAIVMTEFNTPNNKENYVLILESGILLKRNQFIIMDDRQSHIRVCIEHTNFSVFQQVDMSSRGVNGTYVPLFILLCSVVIAYIFEI